MTRNIGIYIFDEVEVLDFAGPFEVFNTASRVSQRILPLLPPPFNTFTIGFGAAEIKTRGGLRVQPHYSIQNHPPLDVLIVPGGVVTEVLNSDPLISWIQKCAAGTEVTASVCTGAFLLAKAGLVDGQTVTTHWEDLSDLSKMFPKVKTQSGVRWIDNGKIITSAGISAGLDMSLHLVEKLENKNLALKTARQMDYAWIDKIEENVE